MEINKEVIECWSLTEKKYKRYSKLIPCGHRYPYVIRWYDSDIKPSNTFKRHVYCFLCEKEFVIKRRFKPECMQFITEGKELGRETIEKLRKNQPKTISKYIENVRKNQ